MFVFLKDAFTSLDLPDFVNFSMDDVTFGDLEFLDLATLPLERSKNKNPTMGAYPDIYFNSIATPSGKTLSWPFFKLEFLKST